MYSECNIFTNSRSCFHITRLTSIILILQVNIVFLFKDGKQPHSM